MNLNFRTIPGLALAALLTMLAPVGCAYLPAEWGTTINRGKAGLAPTPLRERPRAQINAVREEIRLFLKENKTGDHPAGPALLEQRGLALLVAFDSKGNPTLRLRHPGRIEPDEFERLVERLGDRVQFESERYNQRLAPDLDARTTAPLLFHALRAEYAGQPARVFFAYLAPDAAAAYTRGAQQERALRLVRDFLIDQWIMLLALILIGTGAVVVALVWLRQPPPEAAWHDDTRPAREEPGPGALPPATTHEDFHAEIRKTLRVRPADAIHAALKRRFGADESETAYDADEPPRAGASERLEPEIPARIYENLEFEQERWNLPGFQSVYNPVQQSVSARDLDFTSGLSGQTMGESDFLFASRYYRFAEAAESGLLTDIEGFARKFLDEIADRFGPCESVLYLKNHKDRFHPVLSKKSNTFISGPAVQARHTGLNPVVLRQLRDGNCVVSEDGLRVYLPLTARDGMLGAVAIRGERSLYRSRELSALWYEIKKYGEYLRQAKIYEQATTDPESTLFNGLQFQHDLWNDFTMKKEVKYSRAILIVQFCGRTRLDEMRLLGLGLRTAFNRPFRLYRIARDAASILGPAMTEEELEERFREFLNFVRAQNAVDVSVGCALLDDDVPNPEEWFRRATRALEDSKKVGLNHFRTYRVPGDAARFSLRRD